MSAGARWGANPSSSKLAEARNSTLVSSINMRSYLLRALRLSCAWVRSLSCTSSSKFSSRTWRVLSIAAFLVNVGNAPFKIDAGAYRAQHFVAGAEDAFEQVKLFRQQLVDARVGFVAAVDEVDDDDIVLLPVAVAAPDALFDALRVPGQVVVDDQRAKLQVDAFGAGLGGDHHRAALLEVLDQGGAGVGGGGVCAAAPVALAPIPVDGLRPGIAVGAVEEHDACAIAGVGHQGQQILLRAPGFGEDDGFLRGAKPLQFGEGALQRGQQCAAFGVVADAAGQRLEAPQFGDFIGDGVALVACGCSGAVIVRAPFVGGCGQGFVVIVQRLVRNIGGIIEQAL